MDYTEVLRDELVPAFGCTDPLGVAFASAKAVEVLGHEPEKILVSVSGNIIKNVRSVIIPGTGGLKGVEIAAVLGAIAGEPSLELEVLMNISPTDINRARLLTENGLCKVEVVNDVNNLYIKVLAFHGEQQVSITILDDYTKIVEIKKDGDLIFSQIPDQENTPKLEMSFDDIYSYAEQVEIERVKDILDRQIKFNLNIAKEGLAGNWGANIGRLMLKENGTSINNRAIAYAAAAADARMGGCPLPVVINSGSGNQGLTVSVPIIVFGEHLKVSQLKLYRALILGNLLSIYLRRDMGRLTAYCGVASAASASAAGIAFLHGETKTVIEETLSNSLVSISGILCDGAKPSCAMKIAGSLFTALLSYQQAKNDLNFQSGDGIKKATIDETIALVSQIAKEGMKEADRVMVDSMISEPNKSHKN